GAIDLDNLLIMMFIVLALVLVFLVRFGREKKRKVDIYMAGVGIDFEQRSFRDSLSGITKAGQRNWYLDAWFGEKVLVLPANIICITIMVIGLLVVCLQMGGLL
ncbi:MAG: hypothetical protein LBU48_01835, partial [Coriobacteriales bacterium]|nr:hypothetical protein [Coriobacteriales bacterium]